jgi:hypothetical protein
LSSNSEGTSYKTPTFVDKLEGKFQWEGSTAETIVEVETKNTDYYDGTKNLSYFDAFCANFNKLQDVCQKQENCGFCLSSGLCIHGTDEGPVNECAVRHFMRKGRLY